MLLLLLLLDLPVLSALPILLPICDPLLSPSAAASMQTSPLPLLLSALLLLRGFAPVTTLDRDSFLLGFGLQVHSSAPHLPGRHPQGEERCSKERGRLCRQGVQPL